MHRVEWLKQERNISSPAEISMKKCMGLTIVQSLRTLKCRLSLGIWFQMCEYLLRAKWRTTRWSDRQILPSLCWNQAGLERFVEIHILFKISVQICMRSTFCNRAVWDIGLVPSVSWNLSSYVQSLERNCFQTCHLLNWRGKHLVDRSWKLGRAG